MDLIALGAYRKRSLAGVASPRELPVAFLLDWYKDTFDAPRSHSDEELIEMSRMSLASRLAWIEEMAAFTWKARLGNLRDRPSRGADLLKGHSVNASSRLKERLDKDPNVKFALIFGSHARGRARIGSDLDLAVYFNRPPVGLDHLDLLSELSDLAAREVDLVVLNRASALLRHQVLKHRIPFCIKERPAYIRFREQAMTDYDTYRYLAGDKVHG